MNERRLSRLVDQPLRDAWPHEAHAFTHWLAENVDSLADLIGMPLEVVGREVQVEDFQADLLLRNPEDDTRVLVENQLERADHKHLGQILTYLAGLDVKIVVWIAADFREAHLSALKWLNEQTSDAFSFFAIKVRVVRIADSPLAPIFEVMAKPNEWERQLHAAAPRRPELSELAALRKAFWDDYLERHPQDSEIGVRPSAASSIWLPLEPDEQLNVSLWVGKSEVGLFVRGPRGASDGGALVARLEPLAAEVGYLLETSYGRERGGHFWSKRRRYNSADLKGRMEAIDWLHHEAERYVRVLNDLVVGQS